MSKHLKIITAIVFSYFQGLDGRRKASYLHYSPLRTKNQRQAVYFDVVFLRKWQTRINSRFSEKLDWLFQNICASYSGLKASRDSETGDLPMTSKVNFDWCVKGAKRWSLSNVSPVWSAGFSLTFCQWTINFLEHGPVIFSFTHLLMA